MPEGIPVDILRQYQLQGLSNDQIVNYLMQAGYTQDQILRAFNQAAIKQEIAPARIESAARMEQKMEGDLSKEKVEELVEAVIDEKWEALVENINRIIEWKEKTEARMSSLEADFKNMKDNFDKLHQGVLDRVGQYDKNIQDVGTEIKALEKVFQKVLPGFIENVAELSRITNNMKGKQ